MKTDFKSYVKEFEERSKTVSSSKFIGQFWKELNEGHRLVLQTDNYSERKSDMWSF